MYMKSYLIVAMRGRNPDNPSERGRSNGNYRQRLEPNRGGVSNTITSVQKDNLLVEYVAQPIKRVRTEEEKRRRSAYGDEGAKFSSRVMEPRSDGIMGAITTVVEKDNLIMEAKIQENEIVLKKERTSPTKPKGKGWEEVITEDGRRAWVRLRKLTPRECLRLMDVDEKNIDKMCNAGISDSQLYKMAGNSIVVACMEKMFYNLFSNEEPEPTGQLSLF